MTPSCVLATVTGVGLVVPGAQSPAGLVRAGAAPGFAGGEWFDPVRHLGRRGWKYLSAPTRYLLAATDQAVGAGVVADDPDRAAVCLGSNHGISALHAGMDATLRAEGVRGLSPAELPGFSVNTPASWLSIVRERRGFSVTLTDPLVAGLQALLLGMQAIRAGRADDVVAGATEDASPAGRADPAVTGGACVLALRAVARGTDDDGPVRAEVCGGVSRFLPPRPGGPHPDAVTAAARAVAQLVPAGGELPYAFCGTGDTAGVDEAVRSALAARGVRVCERRYPGADGTAGTVSPLLQLAGLLHEHGAGLVVAAAAEGQLAAMRARPAGTG